RGRGSARAGYPSARAVAASRVRAAAARETAGCPSGRSGRRTGSWPPASRRRAGTALRRAAAHPRRRASDPLGRSRSAPASPGGRPARQGPSARYCGAVADVLVLNAGSSTLKYRLFPSDGPPNAGTIERIGEPGGAAADHGAAVHHVLKRLSGKEIGAVGHRIVHGGTRFRELVVVDDAVLQAIR